MAMRDNSRLDDTTRREEEVRRARHERERLDAERARRDSGEPAREGDVLGISDADPNVGEPRPAPSGGRRPSGIEVGERATGLGDVPPSDGASGVDMGGAGEGTDVRHETPRQRVKPGADK
jgi:hypothetical protein